MTGPVDLTAKLSPRLQQLLEPGEIPLLVIPGFPRTIVATDRHVIVGQSGVSPAFSGIFRYEQLSGVKAHFGLISRRVVLEGPELPTSWLETARVGTSTVIAFWRVRQTRIAVERLREMIRERNGAPR